MEIKLGEGYPLFHGKIPKVFISMSLSQIPFEDKELDRIDYLVMDIPEIKNGEKYELILRKSEEK